ncbi:MAG TPA: NAD(P)H-hydrate epimerase [Tepidisphaeraceae bacterium]|nr:NAD(P)H-hydrate epimerase [Tepidisphaeraceae bacterium]
MLHLTRDQVRRIDRLAGERYHIPGIVLMENAARAVADEACRMLGGECVGEILILCGGGNNGGDGLTVARHMHNRGAEVAIGLLTDPSRYQGDALINWQIAQAMGLQASPFAPAMLEDPRPMLIIDAIFGTGLTQSPRDPFPHIASIINHAGIPVLAVDVPSGLDCDTGEPPGACISATRTVTFVARKVGFKNAAAHRVLGDVIVGDIGCPRELIEEIAQAQS